jgi:MFS family permease
MQQDARSLLPRVATEGLLPYPRRGLDFLNRDRIIAEPDFNRWLVPPAALAIHLCIGMAYGFSVFLLPLSQAIGVAEPLTCPREMSLWHALFTTTCDWRVSDLGWVYTLFFVFLGLSAAFWSGWLERAGPRKAGVVAAVCWSGGHMIAALGVIDHQLWLLWLGCGVVGGIGLGLGYISPVSTLMKWFPDRRGMAAGLAIMGFGGGAMIGAPLAEMLMNTFKSPTSVGVWQTFVMLAIIYFLVMFAGAVGYRLPRLGWRPHGWTPPPAERAVAAVGNVHSDMAPRTVQFWLLWAVLCSIVSAGIGVLGMASLMLQEVFGGLLLGLPSLAFIDLSSEQRAAAAAIAAGFTGLLSLFNIVGRFFWATLSDKIGRKMTFNCFFVLGIMLYAGVPNAAHSRNIPLFVSLFCFILSMFGGGFATIPAYIADIFGTKFVSAIQGRILTAWSTAGILGPVVVDNIREAQLATGVPSALAYDHIMYILAALLAVGFLANALVRPLEPKWFIAEEEAAAPRSSQAGITSVVYPDRPSSLGLDARVVFAWLCVGLPIAWGVWMTLTKTLALFGVHAGVGE